MNIGFYIFEFIVAVVLLYYIWLWLIPKLLFRIIKISSGQKDNQLKIIGKVKPGSSDSKAPNPEVFYLSAFYDLKDPLIITGNNLPDTWCSLSFFDQNLKHISNRDFYNGGAIDQNVFFNNDSTTDESAIDLKIRKGILLIRIIDDRFDDDPDIKKLMHSFKLSSLTPHE